MAMNILRTGQPSLITTPPESFTNPPLTPPTTDEKLSTRVPRIIEEIEKRREGRCLSAEPWLGFQLDAAEYKDLQRLLDGNECLNGFVREKLRYDYFPLAKHFVLRMPSVLHERFTSSIVEDIIQSLYTIGTGISPSAAFSLNIKHYGSACIRFPDAEYGKHMPDASFRHSRARYPGVVIEVAYSQKRRDLTRLADEYILGSEGDIRVVVGLDIEYGGKKANKKATLSVWRPKFLTNNAGDEELIAEQTVKAQLFRDENGTPNPSPLAGLHLQLEDFAPSPLIDTNPSSILNEPFFIPAANLCAYLSHAENQELLDKTESGVTAPRKPGLRKRRRESTPPEQLTPEHEEQFQDEERRLAKRIEKDDSNYIEGRGQDADGDEYVADG